MENFNNDALIDLLSGVNKTYNSKEVHDYNYYSKYIGLSVHSSGFYGKQVGNKVIPLELTDFVFNSKEDIVLIVEGRVTLKQAPVNNGIGNLYIKGYGFLVVNDSITYDGRLSTNGDVTKSYVDLNDALTLQAAKDYTDANMGVVGVLPYEDDTYNAGWITGDILEGVVDTMFLLQNGNASQSLIITPPSTSSIDGAIFGVKDGSSGTNISGNAVLSGFYGVSGDLQFMKPGETIIFRCFNNIWSVLTRYNKSYSTKKNLSELDDVSFTTLGNKHIPYYDTNVNLWTNLPISGVLGYTPESTNNKVTNLNSPNDEDYPTTNTVKTYIDNAVVGLLNDRGSYNPISGQYPTTGGSGVGGVPKKGDIWYISANGTINGILVTAGSSVRAIANSPGQTDANWDILDVGLGYVPENLANKITSILGNETNVDRYTSAKAVVDYVTSAISSIPSYTGTLDRITVTGPTIDIASTYAGQTSITTLGTIGTGVWQGTAIADAYIASAATWNGKFNTPSGLITNNIPRWNSVTGRLENSTITSTASGTTANVTIGDTATNGARYNINAGSLNHNFAYSHSGVEQWSIKLEGSGQNKTVFSSNSNLSIITNTSARIDFNFDLSSSHVLTFSSGYDIFYSINTAKRTRVSSQFGMIIGSDIVAGGNITQYYNNNSLSNSNSLSVIGTGHFTSGIVIGGNTINALTQLDLQATTKGLGLNLIAGNLGTTRNGLIWYDTVANQFEGIQSNTVINLLSGLGLSTNKLLKWDGSRVVNSSISDVSNFVFVSVKADFPTPSAGVITLAANTTYFITTTIDLTGDRLVCSANTTIIGGSSENCRIKSTGLASALITSVHSLPLRNITIEAALALNLDGDGTTTALDWFGVNFTDCAVIGTVKDYTNFIMSDCAFLNSGGMTLDGTIGTVGFSNSLFNCNTSNTVFILPSTLTITRRFRIIYSSFIVLSGETGINVNASAVIPTESYILDTVNFSGGGTYITGVTHTSNDSLFINCVGITNTAVNGQLYMQGNATATTVSATNTFYKVAGTTTASSDNSKFSHSNNRLTCDAVISRKYLIQAHLSFSSGANNVCEFGFYDSQLATVRTPSKTISTANATGNAENISFACVVTMGLNDYIEIHCSNTSAANDITVSQLNFAITEIK